MSRRALSPVVVGLAVSLAVGCSAGTRVPTSGTTAPAPNVAATPRPTAGSTTTLSKEWLVVGRPNALSLDVIDSTTAEPLLPLPLGVPDVRWGRFVDAVIHGNSTTVERLDVSKGVDGDSIELAGKWRLPTIGSDPTPVGLAANDRTVALVEAGDAAVRRTS